MPNPLFLGIKDKNKKLANKAQNKITVASAATKPAASAARTTERNTADTDALLSQNSKIGNNAEKYESAGRIGGFDRRQTQSTSAASTAKTKPTSLESALLQGSARESESNAGLLADTLFRSKYATALKKAEASLAKASTAKTSTQTRPTAATDAVAAHGSMADYVLVKQAADRVDFTDWDKKTTTQQRTALKRSGLSEEAQWTLLNRDGSYLETLSVISDLRDNRMDYGLSAAETEQIGGELLTIAAARANATGNEQPYLSTIPRAQMVKYLDEKKTALLQSIGYLESDTVGGNTPLWYDDKEDGPLPTPNPKSARKPQQTPLPQPGPSPDHMIFSNRNVDISQVDAQIIERLMDMAKAYGVKQILFTSGYRSHKKQKELYDDYMEGEEGANYAMEPYTSWHEYGGAVDIYCPELQALPNEAFLEFGLSRPAYVPGHPQLYETWHIQLAENDNLETTFEEGDEYYDSIRQWDEEE